MKIELTGDRFLTTVEMSELTARLDSLHQKTIATIDRLQKDIDTQKARIGNRWKGVTALGAVDRSRVMGQQVAAAIVDINKNSKAEFDGILIEAGKSYVPLAAQRPYYFSKATVLNRQGLGTARRTALEETARRARQVSLAALAQLAIGTGDLVLAAAVVNENDARRENERSFSRTDFLSLLPGLDEFYKAQQYLLIGENRMNAIALAIRVWQSARPVPVATVTLALDRLGEDGAILEELVEMQEGDATPAIQAAPIAERLTLVPPGGTMFG